MTHSLTDEMILEIMNTTGPCDPAYFGERHPSPEEMRAAYDLGFAAGQKELFLRLCIDTEESRKTMRQQEES